ncbi:MAG: sodium/proton-translocating pyrophosphatase, partial [Chloroflexi bacterium]|nr:sodium/proton-translocating pyrophosphatase [Chloroflexota bacterium]
MKEASEFLWFAIVAGVIGLLAAAITAVGVLRKDQGPENIREIGELIREGANAFLKREYMILSVFVVVVAVIIAVFVDYNVLNNDRIEQLNDIARDVGVDAEGPWTALAYLLGAIGSGLAGYIGMSIAVRANTRTATAAQQGLNPALRVAFGSGTVMGLTVTGIGLLGITALWVIFRDPNIVAGFAFGASSIALFARVGGGIYTKAAEVGADLVGKIEVG